LPLFCLKLIYSLFVSISKVVPFWKITFELVISISRILTISLISSFSKLSVGSLFSLISKIFPSEEIEYVMILMILKVINKGAGKQFDPKVVQIFLKGVLKTPELKEQINEEKGGIRKCS